MTWGDKRTRILTVSALVVVSVVALLISATLQGSSTEGASQPIALDPATATPTASPSPSPTPTAEPTRTPRAEGTMPIRVTIPSLDIDGEVVVGAIDEAQWQMIAPEDPDAIAWYDYFPLPGEGGNAVFAGHVDYVGHGPAVFWLLRDTNPGDIVRIELSDGALLTYQVEFNEVYPALGGPWSELFAHDVGEDAITLYTCDGNLVRGEYDSRRVVRANLVTVEEAGDRATPSTALD